MTTRVKTFFLDVIYLTRSNMLVGSVSFYLIPLFWMDWSIDFTFFLTIFLIFSVWHVGTYLHNNVMDYDLGFDVRDEKRMGTPLVDGRVSSVSLHLVAVLLMVVSATLLIMMIYPIAVEKQLFTLFLVLHAVIGFSYNDGLSKKWKHGHFVGVLAYLTVIMGMWFVRHSAVITADFIAMVTISLVLQWLSFSVLGEVKDLDASQLPKLDAINKHKERIKAWAVVIPVILWDLAMIYVLGVRGDASLNMVGAVVLTVVTVLVVRMALIRVRSREGVVKQVVLLMAITWCFTVLAVLDVLMALFLIVSMLTLFFVPNLVLTGRPLPHWFPRGNPTMEG